MACERYVARGDLSFCIGMSEPDSGSDTRMREVKVGGLRIDGSSLR
jgi:alkylation response protein AidB-like acyl-CoA dehydrogenase